jgi:hypothetical protein
MNDLTQISHGPIEVIRATTPMEILSKAVSDGKSIEVLERLMALQERWEANEARKAFEAAMAAASAEMPTLVKNRSVGFASKNGGSNTSYQHEDLAEVVGAVAPILGKHGLSHRFKVTTEPNRITVSCVISHALGHSIENSLVAPADNSGNKNSIQAIGSTITYLSRYSLKASLGLAAAHDDDGLLGGVADTKGPDVNVKKPLKKDNREAYIRLCSELNTPRFTREEVEEWGNANISLIDGMPEDWKQNLRNLYRARRQNPGAPAVDPGEQWGDEQAKRMGNAMRAHNPAETINPFTGEVVGQVVWEESGERPATEDDRPVTPTDNRAPDNRAHTKAVSGAPPVGTSAVPAGLRGPGRSDVT